MVTFAAKLEVMADIKAEYLACPIRQVVSRFGDKWSMLVLYMLHASETGVLRFNEIRRLMTDCSQKMLSQTLKNLEQSQTRLSSAEREHHRDQFLTGRKGMTRISLPQEGTFWYHSYQKVGIRMLSDSRECSVNLD